MSVRGWPAPRDRHRRVEACGELWAALTALEDRGLVTFTDTGRVALTDLAAEQTRADDGVEVAG